jgi:hypothetical protein
MWRRTSLATLHMTAEAILTTNDDVVVVITHCHNNNTTNAFLPRAITAHHQ